MDYSRLVENDSVPSLNSLTIGEQIDSPNENCDYLCQICRKKLMKNQRTNHKPIDCVIERCHYLENEVIKLKDREMKSSLQIKELHNKIQILENGMESLTFPKQEQATPYSLGERHKLRHYLKKSSSEDLPIKKKEINYDNILQTKRSNSRERVGLFGSLGASSQHY